MPSRISALVTGALLAAGATRLGAQATPYIPLDDPRLPIFEHLVTRGDVADPSPFVRPVLRSDALRALAAADTALATPSGRLVHELRQAWTVPDTVSWYEAGARAGAQVYSHARRDPLHPAGRRGASPYGEVLLAAGFGPVVLVTRPAIEPRLSRDADWTGRQGLDVTARLVEGYASVQTRFARISYGQLDRNWGPVGLPGIPLSNIGYEREGLALDLGSRTVRLTALATDLHDAPDTTGAIAHRYYFVHRVGVRLTRRFEAGLWESIVVAGVGRNFENRYRNPVSLGYLTNTIGLGAEGNNEMLGLDLHWRAIGRTLLEAQLALDDFYYQRRYENRDRYAFTLAASGPAGSNAAWRAFYTQVSSLALRTFNPTENFTDAGVGLGRNYSDNDQLTLTVSLPAGLHWLVTPELTLLRQGEGAIDDPYPPFGSAGLQATPTLFIGTVERTWRAAIGITGRQGPVDLTANAGFHHVVNAGHEAGTSLNRFEGRLQVTIGISRRGALGVGD
ncbi:MAG TPA: hypothetical protein VJ847_05395 [Gemmatimonadales bacterium]|jgi:hypothetical protein|nr:hypothetical protein [Gemmatimonadales bacterium]